MTDKKPVVRSSSGLSLKQGWLGELAKKSGLSLDMLDTNNLVYLLVDCSGSMDGDKIEQAKNGAVDFAKESIKKGYAVGLIKFDTVAAHLISPQKELAQFENQVREMMATGDTNMTDAIEIATEKLADKEGNRVICIVTDGVPNNPQTALDAAQEAKDMGIEIMTIGTEDANKNFLDQIATQSELSVSVDSSKLEEGITSMAGLLPEKIR